MSNTAIPHSITIGTAENSSIGILGTFPNGLSFAAHLGSSIKEPIYTANSE